MMDSSRTPDDQLAASDDLSALAWVHDELRRSLESAHKALRRFLKESDALAGSDVDVVDPAVLRTARQQIHQGVGALELVGLPAAATMLRACEAAVQRFVAKPHKLTTKIVDDLEHASFALLDYLGRVLAGKPVSPLAMFPQYRAVQEAAGADRVHPADLWTADWRWNALPDAGVITAPRQPDAVARQAMEQHILALMRGDSRVVAARMSELCAGLGAGSADLQAATLWKLAAAAYEAQAEGLLKPDVFSKRLGSRLLAQLRMIERGEADVSERLAQDLLFFCAQSRAPNERHPAPRLTSIRAAYALHDAPVDYVQSPLGKFDPAWLVQARKRVTAAKDSWSAVAGGELHRMNGLAEQITLVGESLRRLFPAGEALAAELQHAVAHVHQGRAAPSAPLAMEVATGLLYVEASLEDAEFDNPAQAERIQRLADRTSDVRHGAAPAPLEAWMEALYRRVSDRQTMGSVVQELRASLSEAEKRIDQFFRQPGDTSVLVTVPQQLASMRGVLSVLGMNQASAALLRMRDDVDGLANPAPDASPAASAAVFARLAGNLGALGFLIDMLSVQPQMAKSLFVFDADRGTLSPVMGRVSRRTPAAGPVATEPPKPDQVDLIEQAQRLAFTAVRDDVPLADVSRDLERLTLVAAEADEQSLLASVEHARFAIDNADGEDAVASARGELSEALVDFVSTSSGPIALDAPLGTSLSASRDAAHGLPAVPAGASSPDVVDLAEDDEMREIFLEEAREVLQDAETARGELGTDPSDLTQLTTLRRAFHTLKGSSRMVGLKAFGDAAWVLEQLYNTRLGAQKPADDQLLDLTGWSLDYLGAWVEDIAAGRPTTHDAATIEAAVTALAELDALPDAVGTPEDRMSSRGLESSAFGTFDDTEVDEPMALPQVDEGELPPLDAAEFALSFPSDLPSAADLDLRPAPPAATIALAAPSDAMPSFELDLSRFDTTEPPAGVAAADADAAAAGDVAAADVDADDYPATTIEPAADTLGVQLDPAFWAQSFDTQPADLPTVPAMLDDEPARVAPAVPEVDLIALDLDLSGSMPLDSADADERVSADAGPVEAASGGSDDAALATDLDTDLDTDPEQMKVVGPLRIGIPLFNIYLAEADELSRRLSTELSEWTMELQRPVGESSIALAHSLAGSSATVGFADLSQLARTLEHALTRSQVIGSGTEEEGRLFVEVAEEIRRLLHQFAAGFLKPPPTSLVERLAEHELTSARRLDAATAAADLPSDTTSPGDLDLLPDLIDEAELIRLGAYDPAANDSRPAPLTTADAPDAAPAPGVDHAGPDVVDSDADAWPELDAPEASDAVEFEAEAVTGFESEAEREAEPARADESGVESSADDVLAHDLAYASGRVTEHEAALAAEFEHGAASESEVEAESEPAVDPEPEIAAEFGLDLEAPGEHEPFAAPADEALPHAEAPAELDVLAVGEVDAGSGFDPEIDPAVDPEARPAAESAAGLVTEPVAAPAFVDLTDPVEPAPLAASSAETPAVGAATRPAPLADTTFDMQPQPELRALEPLSLDTLRATSEPQAERGIEGRPVDDDIDAVDAVDAELFPIFEEEAEELLPKLAVHLRDWSVQPTEPRHAAACMRTLHTLKGGARLAGAMRLGELAHRLEGRIETVAAQAVPSAAEIVALEDASDQLTHTFEALKAHDEQAYADAVSAASAAVGRDVLPAVGRDAPAGLASPGSKTPAAGEGDTAPSSAAVPTAAEPPRPRAGSTRRVGADVPAIDWSRFDATRDAPRRSTERALASQAAVRVRAPLLDRLVNRAGEVSITRSRIESEVAQIKGSLADLTENLDRLRLQLRDIEFQAETQMTSRLEAAKQASQNFDPLEFDRFTRFQELTRMMAESVNDVATVQRTLHRTLEVTEDELVAQARLTRDMQDDLLRTRMVEFESLSDRLYRVVRQAAKETGKQVRLDIVGGSLEVDRGVLDRMAGAFEHLLRNSITHGVEAPTARVRAGKDASGSIVVALTHEGNEVGVEFRDDGAGLDLARIRTKAESVGLLAAGQPASDAELADLIFAPGFSTAETVTELAGRGVGMDVVRSEVNAMGGRIETATSAGQGTSFKLVLPLTTAVTQVVMVRIDAVTVAIPSTLIEIVRRATVNEVAAAYEHGSYAVGDRSVPFFWLGSLLHTSARSAEPPARTRQVLIIRSAQQRIALHVDEVLGNQEAVVKNLGPQLARLPGLVGVTLLASGAAALIYNPVALATLYGPHARLATVAALGRTATVQPVAQAPAVVQAPLVLVVDDSLTVRRVTQRMLVREGYRVTLAKDGLDALERLAEEKPALVLSDIEMPRMDGFDLVRNIRSDERLRDLPVIMITSRIAQKHRDYAAELGVDHYLGKPYSEEDLLALVGRYTAALID